MKSLLNSKKGVSEEAIEQVPYIILTVIVLIGVYLVMSFFANPGVDSSSIQANVLIYRMLYQPSILSYTESNGRVNPGIIDETLFKDDLLNSKIIYSNSRQISAKITIVDSKYGTEFVTYFHKDWYERLEPVARASWTGFSGAKLFKKTMPCIFRKDGVDIPSTITFEVIIPNS